MSGNFIHLKYSFYGKIILLILLVILLSFSPSVRHVIVFNLVPLCIIGAIVMLLHRVANIPVKIILVIITLFSLCFHVYNCFRFGVNFSFDSLEYWSWAKKLIVSHEYGSTMYRPPLYPFLAATFIFLGDTTGMFLVIFQHLLLLVCVPGIYVISRMFNFSQESSCIAAAFLALNSLLMQAAGYIMTEIVFLSLALTGIAIIKRLYDSPSILLSILTGIIFATATYCRQMLFPVFFAGLLLVAVKMGKRGIILGIIAFSTYFLVTAPWCFRNFTISGNFTMSTSPGIQLFTKAVTFDCLDHNGKYFLQISKPLKNVLTDLSLTGFTTPAIPENDWQVNRIPHVLMDSLRSFHGLSFADASSLLGKTAIEGFMRYPLHYAASVWASLRTLLFKHHDMFPNSIFVLPFDNDKTILFNKFQEGIVYVSGLLFLLFPIAIIYRKVKSYELLVPFCIVCMMYIVTATVQIGFTRYTVPWEPLKALCVAYVIETVLLPFFNRHIFYHI